MRSKSDSDVIYFYTCILKAMIIWKVLFSFYNRVIDYIWIIKNFINDFQKKNGCYLFSILSDHYAISVKKSLHKTFCVWIKKKRWRALEVCTLHLLSNVYINFSTNNVTKRYFQNVSSILQWRREHFCKKVGVNSKKLCW